MAPSALPLLLFGLAIGWLLSALSTVGLLQSGFSYHYIHPSGAEATLPLSGADLVICGVAMDLLYQIYQIRKVCVS